MRTMKTRAAASSSAISDADIFDFSSFRTLALCLCVSMCRCSACTLLFQQFRFLGSPFSRGCRRLHVKTRTAMTVQRLCVAKLPNYGRYTSRQRNERQMSKNKKKKNLKQERKKK